MKAINSINEFVDVMLASKTKFENVKSEIDSKNNALKNSIAKFQSGINSIMSQNVKTSDKELQEISQKQLNELKILLEKVAASMESTRKGMTFINKYEDSFNIAVFGKVKAGKSYTGNFIMGNVIRDIGVKTSYDKIERPKVEVYDRGKISTQAKLAEFDEEGNENFRVDPNEATSAIQLFRLGGMVWIDTPGIGSVTWENEMLAKDYVDNADLIVYMSNSDAAGTQQDFSEMRELYSKGKRFLLLLTQSDTTDEDIDDDGNIIALLVPKSEKDRKSMEDYICESLKQNNINNFQRGREILTISTKLAIEALKTQNDDMFDASNLKNFLDVLRSITSNDAANLKFKTPSLKINSAITDFIKMLKEADSKLDEHMKSLENTKRKLSERNDYLQSKMLNECINSISEIISQKNKEIESNKNGISSNTLQEIVGSEIYKIIMKTCSEEFSGSEKILSGYSSNLKIEGITDLSMKQDTITYNRKVTESYERDPHGIIENVKSWFGKKYYGTRTKTVTETKYIDIGTNFQQVISEIRSAIDNMFVEQIPEIMGKISDDFIAPVAQIRKNADKQIKSAITELEGLKIKC